MKIFQHNTKLTITKNGFRILNVSIKNYPISTSSVWINAGSKKDPIGKEGLSHLFEHLLFTKTSKFPDRNDRLKTIESNGFQYNAFTTLQSQHYFYAHSKNKSSLAFELILDGLFSTTVTKKNLDIEKEVVIAEEKENRQDSSSYIWRLANKGTWGKRNLGNDLYGNAESLKNITLSDYKNFFSENFAPENICFVFINSLQNENEQEAAIEKYNIQSKDKDNYKTTLYFNVSNQITVEKRNQDSLEVALTFILPQIKSLKQRAIIEFISSYFASGWISRFVQKLRVDSSLLYWIYSEAAFFEEASHIRFYFSVSQENFEKTIKLISQEINNAKNVLIDMVNHKNKFLAELERNSVNYQWLMQWYGYSTLLDNNANLNDYYTLIRDLSDNEISEFIQINMIKENSNITVIGKINKEIKKTISQLQ